jgi:aryl-alcohol dehydrogenase-like predicted oxidoreductase
MEYRHLGRSGLKVSEIAYGNWITHGSQVEEQAAADCVHAALDEGITTFDTADAYAGGRAEEVLGRALAGVRRESVEIFTKVYWPTGDRPNNRGLSRKHVTESLHASLRRLGTDYVDLYQAHRYDHETPIEETMRAFDDLVRAGKVLYVGVSEWRAEQIAAALRVADELGLDRIVSNQPQYNMLWRVIEAEVVPLCEKEGIGQIVWSPIAQGVLTGKYAPGDTPPEGSRATDPSGSRFMTDLLTDEVLGAAQRLRPVAADAGLSMAQLAVAWTLQNPNVSAAIVGATRPEQVRDNAVAAGVRLDADIMRRIDEVLGGVVERDPALTASPPAQSSLVLRLVPVSQSSGCRLIGPYSARASSRSVTWSTPTASSARQFSPSQLSASPWLVKMASCRSSAGTTVPSDFSYRQVQGINATPLWWWW